jgi:creatinine amidohydrolase/Fe(II)-dependent formamide hydrolase-like protein
MDGMRTLTKEAKVTVRQHVPMHKVYSIMDVDKFNKLMKLYEQAEEWAADRADDALGYAVWTRFEDIDHTQWKYHYEANRDERFNYLCQRAASKAAWNSPTRKGNKTTIIKRKVK